MRKVVFHLNCMEFGGAERVVSNLSEQFAEDGYEVIVATEWQGQQEYALHEKVRRIHVGLLEKDERSSRIIKYLRRIQYLKKMLLVEKPNIVISFCKKANYRALMATNKTNIPVIIAVRMDPVKNYEERFDKFLIAKWFPKASGAVFQTQLQRDFFIKQINGKSKIIINPIHEKYLNREVVHKRSKEIMHVGRIVDFKNQDLLIRAFAKVYEKYPEYTLKLWGGDSFDGTWNLLEKTIKECGMEKAVFLMGACDDIPNAIENGAFFVMTSYYEGMPNALMEAMALGMPCICTDCPCGGPASLIRHRENGCLVPIWDEEATTKAMLYMIEHPKEANKMGDEARKLGDRANPPAIYKQWKEYVDSLILE